MFGDFDTLTLAIAINAVHQKNLNLAKNYLFSYPHINYQPLLEQFSIGVCQR
ncbi:hypothetical protein [Calothrix sp. NIES-2100]|uniref:hypothetical protein n=1 Tax=Calothrix sp. NIES-2100 TaxID=1954172 RepID=UPI0030D9F48E